MGAKKLPMQPIHFDKHNVARFVANPICEYMLMCGRTGARFDMNTLAVLPGVTRAQHSQFAQLIGYSVSGWGDLSYADRKTVAEADAIVAAMIAEREK